MPTAPHAQQLRFITGLLAITLAGAAAIAQSMPREAFKAKTIFIVNQTGKPTVENGADSELSKWGRFTMADDAATADIKLVLTKAGSTVTSTETPKTDGTGFDSSTSTTFTMGVDMHAYVKGQGLYFFQTNTSSSGEKAGRNLIDNFRKLYPKE
jgi:hypothetical protein